MAFDPEAKIVPINTFADVGEHISLLLAFKDGSNEITGRPTIILSISSQDTAVTAEHRHRLGLDDG